jgi:flagellar hook-length control protein FliK
MTVSLMSLLGGSVNLSAGSGSDEAGDVTLTSDGDAAFEVMMAASELQEISAEELRQFFVSHGADMPESLKNANNKSAGDVLAQLLASNGGKNLPGDMKLALQEMLPQDVMESVEQAFGQMQTVSAGELADVLASLPQRELTAKELSDLVQETGMSPLAIFTALQDTPAASPNLAYAMVEDMGGAEADANLPLPTYAPDAVADGELAAYASLQAGAGARKAVPLDASTMTDNQFAALKRLAAILNGEQVQGEFDWTAQTAQASAALQSETQKATNVVPLMPQQVASASQVATATRPQGLKAVTTDAVAAQSNMEGDGVAEADALMTQVKPQGDAGAQQSKQQGNALLGDGKAAPQTTMQATDGPQQGPSFAASLEQSSALRGAGTADTLNAHLRHVPQPMSAATEQVTVHVGKALANGNTQMEIHLKPAELGRVDVRVETDADGHSHVMVTADRKDTLEMLQRDVRGLERALADAGLKTDSNSLSFNLRGGDGQQQQQAQSDKQGGKAQFDVNGNYADIDERLGESEMALTYDAGRAYRLNVDWGVDISV